MSGIISKLETNREHKEWAQGSYRQYTTLDKGLACQNLWTMGSQDSANTLIWDKFAGTNPRTLLTANTCFLTNLPPCCKWGLKVQVTQITVQGHHGIKVLYLKVKNFKPFSWFHTRSYCSSNGLPARRGFMHFNSSLLVPWSWVEVQGSSGI